MESTLIRIFAGSEITVNLLKAELEMEGILTNVVNEYEQSNFMEFSTSTPNSVDLYILETDQKKSRTNCEGITQNKQDVISAWQNSNYRLPGLHLEF